MASQQRTINFNKEEIRLISAISACSEILPDWFFDDIEPIKNIRIRSKTICFNEVKELDPEKDLEDILEQRVG